MSAEAILTPSAYLGRVVKDLTRRRLPPSSYSYFQQLLAEYRTLPDSGANPQAEALLKEIIVKERVEGLAVDDVRTFEAALIRIEPAETLRRRVYALRRELRDTAGQCHYEAYLKTNPPDPATADPGSVLVDAQEVLRMLHLRYASFQAGEELRGRLFASAAVAAALTAAVVLVVSIWLLALDNPVAPWVYFVPFLPLVSCTMLAGVAGAFVSTLRRIQAHIPDCGNGSPLGESTSVLSVMIAPAIGAMAAMTLFTVFAGGVLQGEVFPAVELLYGDKLQSMVRALFNAYPREAVDLGKMLLWGFVAGFSERLVPDVLDWLGAKAVPAGEGASPRVAPARA